MPSGSKTNESIMRGFPLKSTMMICPLYHGDGTNIFVKTTVLLCSLTAWIRGAHSLYWKNVALHKPTEQKDTNFWVAGSFLTESKYAVDGNHGPDFDSRSCTETMKTTPPPYPWWMVDLEDMYLIRGVQISNRALKEHRLQNFTIEISRYRKDRNDLINPQLCYHRPDYAAAATQILYKCLTPIVGRYVLITVYGSKQMNLCEVEVYATVYEFNQYVRALRGKRSTGNCLRNTTALNSIECGAKCTQTKGCSSFNTKKIQSKMVTCELINEPIPIDLGADEDSDFWTHYVPPDIPTL